MKVEIIKEELQDICSGDVLSLTDGYHSYLYLLFEEYDGSAIGAIDMMNGQVQVKMSAENEFTEVIRIIEEKVNATEYKVFSNDKVKIILGEK